MPCAQRTRLDLRQGNTRFPRIGWIHPCAVRHQLQRVWRGTEIGYPLKDIMNAANLQTTAMDPRNS